MGGLRKRLRIKEEPTQNEPSSSKRSDEPTTSETKWDRLPWKPIDVSKSSLGG